MSEYDGSYPKGTMAWLHGSYYKIGRHGFVFVWSFDSWRKSSKTQDDIYAAIDIARKSRRDPRLPPPVDLTTGRKKRRKDI